jgi:hypothetical protein
MVRKMNHRQTAKIFLSSKMDKPGGKHHSYRQAIINWIESEYPFLEIYPFEKTAYAGHTRSWEIKEIRDCVLFIAIIFEDSEEVDYEIKCALDLKNPVLLFFFPNIKRAKKTWTEFAESRRIKANVALTWEELIQSIRSAIDDCIIGLFNENKGGISYKPPESMEGI